LIVIAALAYLPLIARLGQYSDDAFFLWVGHALGAHNLVAVISDDRPGSSYLFELTHTWFGTDLQVRHLVQWAVHVIGGIALWVALRALFPRQRTAALGAAILFTIYPGYLMMPMPVVTHNYVFSLSLAAVSFALTVYGEIAYSARARWTLRILAVISGLVYLYVVDSFLPLEVVRWLFLLIVAFRPALHAPSFARRIGRLLWSFAPYAIMVAIFLFWRLAIFVPTRPSVDLSHVLELYERYDNAFSNFLTRYSVDVWDMLVSAWFAPLGLRFPDAAAFTSLFGIWVVGVALIAGGAFVIYTRLAPLDGRESARRWGVALIGGGIAAAAAALLLSVFTFQFPAFNSDANRFSLSAVFGAVLVVMGVTMLFPVRLRAIFPTLLIGVATLTQLGNAAAFSRNWEAQRQIFWQLSERAPQLREGTAVILSNPDITTNLYVDIMSQWTFAFNLLYFYDWNWDGWFGTDDFTPPLGFDYLHDGSVLAMGVGQMQRIPYRGGIIWVNNHYETPLVVLAPHGGSCLRVLDSRRGELPIWSGDAPTAALSQIDLILADAPPIVPNAGIFGAPPPLDWCNFFQRGDLARQRGDWVRVLAQFDAAATAGFAPVDPTELLPFIEAALRLNDSERAQMLIDQMMALIPDPAPLCGLLARSSLNTPASDAVRAGTGCV